MAIINRTPHPLNVMNNNGEMASFPKPEADVPLPRVSTTSRPVDVIDGIDVFETVFGEVINLPENNNVDYYVVSRLVIAACEQAAIDHSHLLSPGELIRDDDGRIIGCKGLSR